MAYVPVPKDLSKVKTKVAFNLTKRQIICFAVALILGLPLFFLLKDSAGTSLSVEVEYITDLKKVMEYGVMSVPALVVNNKVVSTGKVLKTENVQKLLQKIVSEK